MYNSSWNRTKSILAWLSIGIMLMLHDSTSCYSEGRSSNVVLYGEVDFPMRYPIKGFDINLHRLRYVEVMRNQPPSETWTAIKRLKSDDRGRYELNVDSKDFPILVEIKHPYFEVAYLRIDKAEMNERLHLTRAQYNRGITFVAAIENSDSSQRVDVLKRLVNEKNKGENSLLVETFPLLDRLESALQQSLAVQDGLSLSEYSRLSTLLAYAKPDGDQDYVNKWLAQNNDVRQGSGWKEFERGTLPTGTLFSGDLASIARDIAKKCGIPDNADLQIVARAGSDDIALLVGRHFILHGHIKAWQNWHVVVLRNNGDWRVSFWRRVSDSAIYTKT